MYKISSETCAIGRRFHFEYIACDDKIRTLQYLPLSSFRTLSADS